MALHATGVVLVALAVPPASDGVNREMNRRTVAEEKVAGSSRHYLQTPIEPGPGQGRSRGAKRSKMGRFTLFLAAIVFIGKLLVPVSECPFLQFFATLWPNKPAGIRPSSCWCGCTEGGW
eukprot:COSAG04_NODE_719_length_10829_cov_6.915750_6_plen_120_part_00